MAFVSRGAEIRINMRKAILILLLCCGCNTWAEKWEVQETERKKKEQRHFLELREAELPKGATIVKEYSPNWFIFELDGNEYLGHMDARYNHGDNGVHYVLQFCKR